MVTFLLQHPASAPPSLAPRDPLCTQQRTAGLGPRPLCSVAPALRVRKHAPEGEEGLGGPAHPPSDASNPP